MIIHKILNCAIFCDKIVKSEGAKNIMKSFVDDFAGAIHDILYYVSYFIAGLLIVGIPLYLLTILFDWISSTFY